MCLKTMINSIRIFFGAEICPVCGSDNIMKHGFEGSNMRYECKLCGTTTRII